MYNHIKFIPFAEQRLCRRTDMEELSESMQVVNTPSTAIAHAIELVKGKPGWDPDDNKFEMSKLLDESVWWSAWNDPTMLSHEAIDSDSDVLIALPQNILDRLEPDVRKQLLIEFLEERFPVMVEKAGKDNISAVVNGTDAAKQKQLLEYFQCVGMKMRGEDPSTGGLTIDPLRVDEVEGFVNAELTKQYVDDLSGELTPRAFADFAKTLKDHPTITPITSASVAEMKMELTVEKTQFATALQRGLITEPHLKTMTEKYQNMKKEQDDVVEKATALQQRMRSRIDVLKDKGLFESLGKNFKGLQTWQKGLIIGAGGYLLFRTLFRKDKSAFEKWVGTPIACVLGFYLLGGRKMVEGTGIGDGLEKVEGWFDTADKAPQKYGRFLMAEPELSESVLRTYTEFFTEVAGEDVGPEVEALGYISLVEMGTISSSFSLSDGAKGGTLNLRKGSPLIESIIQKYQASGEVKNIIRRLMSANVKLGDFMAHVYYLIGAAEHPRDHQKVEKARAGGSYDDIPDGEAREIYKRLANDGLILAKTKYANRNWFEVVGAIAKEPDVGWLEDKVDYVTDKMGL